MLTMGQFSKVLLDIDNAHIVPQRAPGLWTRLRYTIRRLENRILNVHTLNIKQRSSCKALLPVDMW